MTNLLLRSKIWKFPAIIVILVIKKTTIFLLVHMVSEAIRGHKFQNFPGGAYPQTTLVKLTNLMA